MGLNPMSPTMVGGEKRKKTFSAQPEKGEKVHVRLWKIEDRATDRECSSRDRHRDRGKRNAFRKKKEKRILSPRKKTGSVIHLQRHWANQMGSGPSLRLPRGVWFTRGRFIRPEKKTCIRQRRARILVEKTRISWYLREGRL